MAIVLALLAAGANALATVLQRLGVEEVAPHSTSSSRLLIGILKRPVWLAGLALTTASFLLQAIALSLGNLSTVQPVMVTEILFLVIILGTWFHRGLHWREWLGAVGTVVGLGVFLSLSSASGGHERPSRDDWILLLVASLGAMAIALLGAQRGARSWRAACYGVAAGIAFALTAAFVKTTADQWSRGPVYVLSHFECYAVAASGLFGLVVSQHALEAGPVAASQSALLIVNPISSIAMGVYLFNDHIHASGDRAVLEALFLAIMFCALLVLSQSPLISSGRNEERLSGSRPLRAVPPGEYAS